MSIERIAEFGDQRHVLPVLLERLEDGRHLEIGAHFLGCPIAGTFPERYENHSKASDGISGGLSHCRKRWNHGIQKWQRYGRAHAAKNRAPGNVSFHVYHRFVSFQFALEEAGEPLTSPDLV